MNKKKAENKKESLSVEGLASDEILENVSGGGINPEVLKDLKLERNYGWLPEPKPIFIKPFKR